MMSVLEKEMVTRCSIKSQADSTVLKDVDAHNIVELMDDILFYLFFFSNFWI